jgi:hypothetical protein
MNSLPSQKSCCVKQSRVLNDENESQWVDWPPTPEAIRVLRHGRSTKPILRVLPDAATGLYRIEWPDIGLSQPANLSRCADAALCWAERAFVFEHRKNSAARTLISLNNFSWSASPARQNCRAGTRQRRTKNNALGRRERP